MIIEATKPKINVVAKKKNMFKCHLINMSVLTNNDIYFKEIENFKKYARIHTEFARMWDVQVITISIFCGDLVSVPT